MLTDWERRRLAEIERGLADDFSLRSRVRRRLAVVRLWPLTSMLLCFAALALLCAVGAWNAALTLAVICGLVACAGRTRKHRHDRH